MLAGGGGRPPPSAKEPPSPSILTLKNECDSELGEGRGEGRLKLLTLKNLDVIDLAVFFNTLAWFYPLAG